jgi:hypothetical protein
MQFLRWVCGDYDELVFGSLGHCAARPAKVGWDGVKKHEELSSHTNYCVKQLAYTEGCDSMPACGLTREVQPGMPRDQQQPEGCDLTVCVCLCVCAQIELYSHVGAIRSLVDWLKSEGWSVAAVFCMDVAFVNEPSKYIAGAMQVSGKWATKDKGVVYVHHAFVWLQAQLDQPQL